MLASSDFMIRSLLYSSCLLISLHYHCYPNLKKVPSVVSGFIDVKMAFKFCALSYHCTGRCVIVIVVSAGPDPDPQARYLFDTHYPDYFPPRPDFASAVSQLQARNISVFPYINGRIFDIHSDSYLSDNGGKSMLVFRLETVICSNV